VTGDSIMFNIQEGGGTRDNATMQQSCQNKPWAPRQRQRQQNWADQTKNKINRFF